MRLARLFVALGALGASVALGETAIDRQPVSLAGVWKFHVGDDPAWAEPDLDDRAWPDIGVPTGWGPVGYSGEASQLAWYRKTLRLPAGDRGQLGLSLGPVDSAYELFVGGRRVAGVGRLPPQAEEDYDRRIVVPIPASLIGGDGRLVIAVRAWTTGMRSRVPGLYDGPILVGPLEALSRRAVTSELPTLILAVVILCVGVSNLTLGWRGREHTWFGAMALAMAAYVLLRTQSRYLVFPFLTAKKLEHALLYFFSVALMEFMWPLIERRFRWWERAYQALNAVGGVVMLAAPGLSLAQPMLRFWEASFAAMAAAESVVVWRVVRAGQPEARLVALGFFPLMFTGAHDILLDFGLLVGPRLLHFGTLALIVAMTITLSRRFKRTHNELVVLHQDLEARVADRTAALAERSRELAEANDAKTRFLATVSHEIRTPLNGILGVNRMLLQTPLQDRQRELGEIVQAQGGSLLRIVNDILDYSKLEVGRAGLEASDFDLHALLRDVSRAYEQQASAKGIAFVARIDDALPARARGDLVRLRQVLDNLLSNAVKFTEHGSIRLSAAPLPSGTGGLGLRFEIEDSGIGIDEATARVLFQPFTQADNTTARRFGGTGLGLAIAKSLVEMMGGGIGCQGEPGRGSTFWFTVQLDAAQGAPESAPVSTAPQLRGVRALMVDDNAINRMVTAALLEEAGCNVDAAASGLEAVSAAARSRYDVIFMDCRMPEMDGYAAAAEIRRRETGGRRTPIVALTAHAVPGERERCQAAGMDDCVTKPAGPDVIARVLERWVSRIDPQVLDDLARRSPAMLRSVIEAYLRSTPDEIRSLRAAVAARDRRRVDDTTHDLVGSALIVGASEFARLLREFHADSSAWSDADGWIARVEAEQLRVHHALAARLASPDASSAQLRS